MSWVQSVAAQGFAVTSVTTAAITTTSGNSVAFAAQSAPGFGGDVSGVSDSNLNTWTATAHSPTALGGGLAKTYMYTARSITGGSGHTFKTSLASSGYPNVTIAESTNTGAVDSDAGVVVVANTTHNLTIAPTTGSDWFECGGNDSGANPETWTQGSGWTKGGQNADGADGVGSGSQYQSNMSSSTTTATYTTGDAVDSADMAVGFLAAVATNPVAHAVI